VTKSSLKSTKGHILVGIWVSADEYASEVEYNVESKGTTFKVEAIDGCDGEVADIFEVKWDEDVLSFATHWNSTGRFSRCRLQAISKDRVSLTYTHTDNETLHRKLKSSRKR
jgi:hypothetical protein